MSKKIEELPTLDPANYNPEEDLILIEKGSGGTFCTTSEVIFKSQNSTPLSFINFLKSPQTLATITAAEVINKTKQYSIEGYGVPSTAKYVLIHFIETSINYDTHLKQFIFADYPGGSAPDFSYRRWYQPKSDKSNNQPHRWGDTAWFYIQPDEKIKIKFEGCNHFTIDIQMIAYS